MRGKRNLTTVLGALLALIGTVFVLRPAQAAVDPGNLPAPLGQATNSGTGSLGCPGNANWKGFDANGTTEQVGPVAVFIESGGRVWVSDFRNSDLDQAHSTAGKVFSWPSIAQATDCNQPDREIDGINQPEGIVVDSSGNLFVADTGDSHIFKFSAARVAGFTTIGTGAANVRDATGAPSLDIDTSNGNGSAFTRGLTIGPDGNLWAADDGNNRVIALDVLGTHNNMTPVKAITQSVCHPKAVAFVGTALFVADYPQGACTGQVVRYDAANNAAGPSATFAFDHPIDMTGVGATTLAVTSTSGGYALIANAPTAATSATAPALNKTATENGATGSYGFGVNTYGISTQAANGNPTLVADSSNFRVLNIDLTPVAQKTNTSTAVTSSKNPSNQGDQVTFTATVTPASGTTVPTGTVQFKDGTTNLGTPQTLDNTGKATLQTPALAAGTHSITAVYSGDSNFNGSTSPALTQTVNAPNKINTTTAVTSSKNPSTEGDPVTFTATVTPASGNAVPTGNVQFKLDGANLGQRKNVDIMTGKATITRSDIPAGSHAITAVYSGDQNFNASTSPALMQTVNGTGTSTTVTPSNAAPVAGQQVTFTAKVNPASGTGTPTGTVQFVDNGATLGAPVALVNGSATSPADTMTEGSHTIAAIYLGDANFDPSIGNITLTVTAAGQTVLVEPSSTFPGGHVTVTGSGWGDTRTVQVTLESTPVLLGTVTTDAAGGFSFVATIPTNTAPGAHQIVVTSGSLRASAPLQVAVVDNNPAPTTTTAPTATTINHGILRVTGRNTGRLARVGIGLIVLGVLLVAGAEFRRPRWYDVG